VSASVPHLTSVHAYPQTVRKVHVGCGPHALLDGWCNADVRRFEGVDHVMDATEPWPFSGLTHVFGEHFIEHLEIDKAIDFLVHAGRSLAPGGRIRLSTPNLAWVMASLGYADVELHEYGHSRDVELSGFERHGNYSVLDGLPSVIIAEGARGSSPIAPNASIRAWIDHEFLRHVRSGH
jgi:hypothetical protein